MISHTFLRILPKQNTAVLAHVSQLVELGKPTCKKSEVFLNIVPGTSESKFLKFEK